MKNFFIFLSILTVAIFATLDLKDRISQLDNLTMKTPAQVEMKENKFNMQKDKNDFNKFKHKDSQNNNNNPQNKHKDFKMYR